MGDRSSTEIDAWLRQGGMAVAASDRAARALSAEYDRARLAEGLTAWPAANIQDWKSFVRAAWERVGGDGRLVLNPTQEQALWAEIAGSQNRLATLLEGPRFRLARLAMEAHELLCSYAPRCLQPAARSSWQQDAAAFSAWLAAFDRLCRESNLLSPSRLPLELLAAIEGQSPTQRPPLLLAGFDRILPVQRRLFDAWGAWQETAPGQPAADPRFFQAADAQSELAACARWCGQRLAANPKARLLVVTQDASLRRGEIARALLQATPNQPFGPVFEFSLGIPLGQVALAKSAHLLLRWLSGSLSEQETDWLLSTGHAASNPEETPALQTYQRALRRRSLERPDWTLQAFLSQPSAERLLPAQWVERVGQTQRLLQGHANRPRSPIEWAELVPRLLATAGWPGARPLSSAEFQAARRWQQAVETAGSLGFDGRRIRWPDFLSALARTLAETLFSPESRQAPIQIAGPAESAGLTADAVWFLGADEDRWPADGPLHPLLPPDVQREAGMPHATPQSDWDLALTVTRRLLSAGREVVFSFAQQNRTSEARPSPLIGEFTGTPQPLPPELAVPVAPAALVEMIEDASRIPFPRGKAPGGAGVLTAQSQCPFKAFATARLGAQGWQTAETGLTAAQRGQLLHAVMHEIWAGPPLGLRSHVELLRLPDRASLVAGVARRVLAEKLPPGLRERMPRRYLELEEMRLAGLVAEWLDYEASRIAFEVEGTEVSRSIDLAGLVLDLRLDRVDRLLDGSLLVIDYKTGNVTPQVWDLPRPEDVQLPLYAGFALDGELGGLVFAEVRAGKPSFAGRVGDAKGTLIASLGGGSALVRNGLTLEQLLDWREAIERLAEDFVAGRAEVDPRQAPKTCERCGLQTLCRVHENRELRAGPEEDGEIEEAGDE
jgi:ATP-dependent helicase/nuclease subunit B